MKKSINKLFIALLAVVSFTACNDFLEPELTDALDPSAVFETVEDAEKVLFGAYSGMVSSSYILNNARLADNLKIGSGNRGQGVFTHSWQYNSDDDLGWATRWRPIFRANDVIFNLDLITDATDAERNQLRGEALAIRAAAHLDILRMHAARAEDGEGGLGIPYMNTANNPQAEPARSTIGEVYNNIISDFTEALSLVSDTGDASRLNPLAIEALLARTKLERGDWAGAKTHANNVISSASAPSLSGATEYQQMFKEDLTGETLWMITNTGSSFGQSFFEASTGDNFFAPTDDLINSYEASDIRGQIFFLAGPSDYIVNKYPGRTAEGIFGLNDIKYIRMSEVYLIRAEAEYRSSGGGLADLNAVRTARGASTGSESGGALFDAIMLERRKELCYEADRWFQLKRNAIDCVRGSDCNSGACLLPATDHRWLAPIPQSEMNANDNMVQNPGY